MAMVKHRSNALTGGRGDNAFVYRRGFSHDTIAHF
jgi:hypothetical protein